MRKTNRKKKKISQRKELSPLKNQKKHKLAKKLRGISKAEILNEAQQEVKFALKPHGTSNILHIEVIDLDSPGKIKDIHNQGNIEIEMKKNFKTKFVEVYDTPIPHKPFITWFGHDGITNEAKMISDGTFISPR